MRTKKTTVTVQFDVEYDSNHVEISEISNGLGKQLAQVQDASGNSPTGEAGWWTRAVRTFDSAAEPIGFTTLSCAFDHIGEALDAFDDDEIGLAEFVSRIREQVGEREASR